MRKHVVRRPNTVAPQSFYGRANTLGKFAHKHGEKIIQAGKAGIKIAKKLSNKSDSKSNTTRSIRLVMQGVSQHNDMSEIPAKVIYIGKKMKKDTVGSYQLTHIAQAIYQGAQGKQGVNNLTEELNVLQMTGQTSTSDLNYAQQWSTDPWLLNPYSTAPQNAIYTNTPNSVEASDRIFIKSLDHRADLINLSSQAVKIDIYYCLCTSDTHWSPAGAWIRYFNEPRYLQPTAASGPSLEANSPIIGAAYYDLLGQVPKNSQLQKMWKIIDHRKIILQGGDTIKTHTKFVLNKTYTREQFTMLSATNVGYKAGLSLVPMMIQNGSLVGYEPDGINGVPATQVSYCHTKVGVVTQDVISFAALPAPRFNIKRMEIGTLQETTNQPVKISDIDARIEGNIEA